MLQTVEGAGTSGRRTVIGRKGGEPIASARKRTEFRRVDYRQMVRNWLQPLRGRYTPAHGSTCASDGVSRIGAGVVQW
jgi:hypothetical protein